MCISRTVQTVSLCTQSCQCFNALAAFCSIQPKAGSMTLQYLLKALSWTFKFVLQK